MLEVSVANHGTTWLHDLHLGVAKLESGDYQGSREHFHASLAQKDNWQAHRNLALTSELDNNIGRANDSYAKAWTLCSNNLSLALEYTAFLERVEYTETMVSFIKSLPPDVQNHERIQLYAARQALENGDLQFVRDLLRREIITIRESEVITTELWDGLSTKEAKLKLGRALRPEEKNDILEANPSPYHLDFVYALNSNQIFRISAIILKIS